MCTAELLLSSSDEMVCLRNSSHHIRTKFDEMVPCAILNRTCGSHRAMAHLRRDRAAARQSAVLKRCQNGRNVECCNMPHERATLCGQRCLLGLASVKCCVIVSSMRLCCACAQVLTAKARVSELEAVCLKQMGQENNAGIFDELNEANEDLTR